MGRPSTEFVGSVRLTLDSARKQTESLRTDGGPRCPTRRRCSEQGKTSGKANRRPRRLANSCTRRSSTYVKASTEHARPSRPLRSVCRRHGGRASTCRRPRQARSRARRAGARRMPTALGRVLITFRGLDPAPPERRCSMKATPRRPAGAGEAGPCGSGKKTRIGAGRGGPQSGKDKGCGGTLRRRQEGCANAVASRRIESRATFRELRARRTAAPTSRDREPRALLRNQGGHRVRSLASAEARGGRRRRR